MQYHTIEQLGPKRLRTPQGFLLCLDVPVARTGMQLYGPGETPVSPGTADVVRIDRDAEEVFHPECIGSLRTAPLVNDHPLDESGGRADITVENWRDLSIGHPLNPRRGESPDDDMIFVDLLFTDRDAIDLIDAGKREISVGYDAEYDEIAPGHGRQRNIRANHIALVERGRCGPRCSIGDTEYAGITADCECEIEQPQPEEGAMRKGMTWADRIRAAFKARDADALENVLGEEPQEEGGASNAEHHVHVHLPGAPNGGAETGGEAPAAPSSGAPDLPAGGAAEGGGTAAPTDLPPAIAQAFAQNNAEHEELWNAIESLAGQGQGTPAANGDAFPHRDARRLRDNIGGDAAEDNSRDELGEAPSAPAGGTTVLPGFEMEAPPGTQQNDMRRARDSALFQDSFNEAVAYAEIILPGIRLPTFDCAAKPQKTVPEIRKFRADVLDRAWRDPELREIIEQFTGGHSPRGMTVDAVRLLFKYVADAKARANKATMSGPAFAFDGGSQPSGGIQTARDLQAVLDKHYAAQRPAR